MLDSSPIFLISSERSGTNLLRKLITQHQDVYFGPSPAHFLKHLYYREPYYGDLNDDKRFEELIKDALDLCYVHFSPWSISFNVDDIIRQYDNENFTKRNSIFLTHFLMTLYARKQGYQTYFCKDNALYEFSFEILNCLPNAKFIYLHRDPRDYAVSQYERSVETDSLVRIASLWAYEQVKCISVYNSLNNKQVFKLSYEDMISNSKDIINKLCRFLNVNFIEEQKEVEVFTGKSEEWQNLDKPIMKTNSKKYLKKFDQGQIRKVESLVINQMDFLGYKRENQVPKITFIQKIFDVFVGELKFRLRSRKLEQTDDFKWVKERNQLLKRLSIKWQKRLF